jgi:hypothetical protein
MSDQQTGGDGSVRWSVDADNVSEVESRHISNGRHQQHGIDKAGDAGDWFTVSIRVPDEIGSVDAYLRALKDGDENLLWGIKKDPVDGKRVYFNVRIEKKTHDQIRVSWGASDHVRRPRKA